jgi:hypothetical protein
MRLVLSSLLVACSGGGATPDAKDCTVGDLSMAPEIQLFFDGIPMMFQPMDPVPLEQPIQGGWVFYVEPHIRNMEACHVQLTTSLTDTVSNSVVVFESRTATLSLDGTGWAVPINEENDGLVAACPQSQLSRNLDGQPYLLQVVAMDPGGRQAQASVQLVPTCSESFCTCQCDASYKLGDSCP